MLYQAIVKELVVLRNIGLVVSLYFVQDCRKSGKLANFGKNKGKPGIFVDSF